MKSRLISIYGEDAIDKLSNSTVAVCGLGGVGSYCATSIARGGVENLIIIDFDTIEKSNINRQQFALNSTIGKYKVDIAEALLLDINPNLNITKYQEKIDNSNTKDLIKDCDYIIDCVDDVHAKIALAQYAQFSKIKFISCMGTALRKDSSKLKFSTIYNTSVCPLSKTVRQAARKEGLDDFDVLFSTEPAVRSIDGNLGSTSYLPPIAGMMIAGYALEKLVASK